MENHPINLVLRFFLELAGLVALGWWGWTQHAGFSRWAWTILLPVGAAILWGVFRVPNDPGKAPVAVPGWVRLLLEAAYFGSATACLYAAGARTWALVFGGVTLLHYVISYRRILWMLKQG